MILGLTGSYGSGKSTVASMLQSMADAYVIDADQIARDLQRPGQPGLAAIVSEFGPAATTDDGELNRRKLADIVFADDAQLERLNDIIHPLVYAEMGRQIEAHTDTPLVVLMVPLLYETGGDQLCDQVAVVTLTDEERIKRLMTRDGVTEEQIRLRLEAQMPQPEKVEHADFVIDNSGTPENTRSQVKDLLDKIGLTSRKTS